jgi:hypothetical protein
MGMRHGEWIHQISMEKGVINRVLQKQNKNIAAATGLSAAHLRMAGLTNRLFGYDHILWEKELAEVTLKGDADLCYRGKGRMLKLYELRSAK